MVDDILGFEETLGNCDDDDEILDNRDLEISAEVEVCIEVVDSVT
jgi:hypothetical protein